jgi:hypothetical protein
MLNEFFRAFLQPLQVNSGEVPPLGHDRFLANPFQFVSHRIVRRYVVPGLRASQGTRRYVFCLIRDVCKGSAFFVDVIAYYLCDAVTYLLSLSVRRRKHLITRKLETCY